MIPRFTLLTAGFLLAPLLRAHDGTEADHVFPGVATPPDAKAIAQDGEFKFETVPGWGVLPDNANPGPTHGGMARDKAGNVYCSTDTDRGILVFGPDGKFLRNFGKEFNGVHGLMLREEKDGEYLYAAWLKGGQGLKVKLDGTVVLKISCPMESGKYGKPGEWKPTSMDSAPDGSIFVADGYGKSFVHKFDAAGKYLLSFGGAGNDNDHFNTPHGIGVDLRGEKPLLLVSDRGNGRLQHFDLDGKFVANVARGLRAPCAVSFEGKMVVVPELQGRVTILDGANKEVAHLGDNPDTKQRANFGSKPEEWSVLYFTAPHGACWDGNGGVFVQDWNATGRIRYLKKVP